MTQGAVITAIRSKKYFDCNCFGIVISARCDIANNKISKVFYLEAIPLGEWVFSNEGFILLIDKKINSIINQLNNICRSNGLEWDSISLFSEEEFKLVIEKEVKSKKNRDKALKLFEEYHYFENKPLDKNEKRKLLLSEEKNIKEYVSNISNGKYTHLTYIPQKAFTEFILDGVIIDLQELDYLDIETVEDLEDFVIDVENSKLSVDKKEKYNKKFVLDGQSGYSIIYGEIKSPWIEYLMQRFSNVFTRIGVDNPSKNDFDEIIDRILE